jgi:hypothetical protein
MGKRSVTHHSPRITINTKSHGLKPFHGALRGKQCIKPQRREEHEGVTKKKLLKWLPIKILRERLRVLRAFVVKSLR